MLGMVWGVLNKNGETPDGKDDLKLSANGFFYLCYGKTIYDTSIWMNT